MLANNNLKVCWTLVRRDFRFQTVKSREIERESDRIHPDFSLFRRQDPPGSKEIGRGNVPGCGK